MNSVLLALNKFEILSNLLNLPSSNHVTVQIQQLEQAVKYVKVKNKDTRTFLVSLLSTFTMFLILISCLYMLKHVFVYLLYFLAEVVSLAILS